MAEAWSGDEGLADWARRNWKRPLLLPLVRCALWEPFALLMRSSVFATPASAVASDAPCCTGDATWFQASCPDVTRAQLGRSCARGPFLRARRDMLAYSATSTPSSLLNWGYANGAPVR